MKRRLKAFCCWSGGKDSCLALYRALKNYEVLFLINMIAEDGKHSRTHGISSNSLKLQSESIRIPIIQRKSSWETYEEKFKIIIRQLKTEAVDTGIFGDIDLQEHRDWVERVCKETGITPVLPLWKVKREELMSKFINAGFKAIVVSTNEKFLSKQWLGREINENFIMDLKSLGNIDLCGEAGEYHTFVFDGPIFKKPVEFVTGDKKLKDKHWFLELIPKENDRFRRLTESAMKKVKSVSEKKPEECLYSPLRSKNKV